MSIFKKTKQSDELPKSGCGSITHEQIEGIIDSLYSDEYPHRWNEDMYSQGFIAGLLFAIVPESAHTHGLSAAEFLKKSFNQAQNNFIADVLEDVLSETAHDVLDDLDLNCDVSVEIKVAPTKCDGDE